MPLDDDSTAPQFFSLASHASWPVLLSWENIGLSLFTLALVYLTFLMIQKKRWIDAINRLPGLPDDVDALHPIWGHVHTLLDTMGSIPRYPQFADTVGWYFHPHRIPQMAQEHGLIRVWMFHPVYMLPLVELVPSS